MLRKIYLLSALLSCLFVLLNSGEVRAVETLVKGAPAQVFPMGRPQTGSQSALTEDLLIVRDVIVDKTAKNVMLAREEAISDARRQAFMKLAERNMTPDEFKILKAPDDKTLAVLTHDFEINSEKLSTTRYVASFTIRFRDAVRSYIPIVEPVRQVSTQITEETTTVETTEPKTTAAVKENNPQTFLILPYFETSGGKTVLWDDPNPWRVAWQKDGHLVSGSGIHFVVPIGDIGDIAAGDPGAVWSGNYKAIEKLSQTYGTTQAVLSVASKSGSYMTIDMYFFRNGRLTKREVLQPFVGGKNDEEAMVQAMRDVVQFLQKRPAEDKESGDPVADISRSLVGETKTLVTTVAAPSGSEFEASTRFDSPAIWMDMQRRLSSLSPALKVDIRALSSNGAQFTMRYNGDVQTLRGALLEKGIMMEAPAVEVNPSVLVSGVPAQKYIYGLHLMN